MSDLAFLTTWMVTEAMAMSELAQRGLCRVGREEPEVAQCLGQCQHIVGTQFSWDQHKERKLKQSPRERGLKGMEKTWRVSGECCVEQAEKGDFPEGGSGQLCHVWPRDRGK